MTTMTTAATIGEIKDLIDLVANDSNINGQDISIDELKFDQIVHGVNENLHLRDYLLGLPIEHSMENCIDVVSFFINNLLGKESAIPFYTILSAYHYELGEKIASKKYLTHGLNADYPLALLLDRIYSANWATDSIGSMRNELHHKVVKQLEESADQLI